MLFSHYPMIPYDYHGIKSWGEYGIIKHNVKLLQGMVNLWYSSHRHNWYVAGCGYFPSTVKQTNKGFKVIIQGWRCRKYTQTQKKPWSSYLWLSSKRKLMHQPLSSAQPFPHSAGQVTPWCFLGFSERSLLLADLRSFESFSFCLATKSFMMSTGFATSDGCAWKFPLKVTSSLPSSGIIWLVTSLNHILNPMESE